MPSLRKVTLTPREVARAIYIDFEGTETEPATFLGVFCESKWEVFIIEPRFHLADVAHKLGAIHVSSLPVVCRELMAQSKSEGRKIVAWSSREVEEVIKSAELTIAERLWWESNVVNLLPPAKRWARREGVKVARIEGSRSARPNKWSLSEFRKATGYPEIAGVFEPGKTASRIRHVRAQLETRQSYAKLTPVAKGKWSKVLTHNYHDCAGLAHVARAIFGRP